MDGNQGPSAVDADRSGGSGVAGVGDALSALEGVESRSLAEQVNVLDRAHGALRRALDAPAG